MAARRFFPRCAQLAFCVPCAWGNIAAGVRRFKRRHCTRVKKQCRQNAYFVRVLQQYFGGLKYNHMPWNASAGNTVESLNKQAWKCRLLYIAGKELRVQNTDKA